MGVMAFHAVAFHNNAMCAFGIFRQNAFVTFIADFVRVRIQQLPVRGGMRVMALRALSRFHRSMDKRVLELLLKIVMALQTKLPLCIGFEFKFVLLGIS